MIWIPLSILFLLSNVSRTSGFLKGKSWLPLDARIFRFRACSLQPLCQSRFSLRELLNADLAEKFRT